MEKLFLAAKDFNTNLIQFLLPNHVIISNTHVCSFMCTIFHMHGHALNTVYAHKILCTKDYNL